MGGDRTSATLYLLIYWWLSGLLHGWQMFGEVRFKNPCHTCQCILNILILSDFLWHVEAKSLVIRCHHNVWQAMTTKNGSICHRNLLKMRMLMGVWQVWQRFFILENFAFQCHSEERSDEESRWHLPCIPYCRFYNFPSFRHNFGWGGIEIGVENKQKRLYKYL